MGDIIVFGAGDIAQLAAFYFENDSPYKVRAFVVDDEYKHDDSFCERPLVGMSEVERRFPPDRFSAFVAVGYSKMNLLRKTSYDALRARGYSMVSYISSHCRRFANSIGDNAFILEDNTIQPFAKIGNNVVLWSGNHIGHHSVIGDHCFVASHVVISGGVTIGASCFIGVNATIRDHISIAEGNLIGAGALILKSTEPHEVYRGSPAQRMERTISATEKS